MWKYILFDLDGTLTNPGLGITNSVMYSLKKYGIEACLSYYLAFSSAERYLKDNAGCREKMLNAREEYVYAYKIILSSTDISWKQKVKAALLLYCPKFHSILF